MPLSKKLFISFFLILVFLLNINSAMGFSGLGDGTKENPYQITTISQLSEVRSDLSANYILMNDLDFNESSLENWIPLGYTSDEDSNSKPFDGVFNGNDKTISNLNINGEQRDHLGLFSSIRGSVSNLTIRNSKVNGSRYVGVLAGFVYASVINCHVIDSFVSSTDCGGILAGNNIGVIDFCTVENSSVYSFGGGGGFISDNKNGTIRNSSAVSVTVNSDGYAGGITGMNMFDSRVENCSAIDCIISSKYSMAGGISGWSVDTIIRDCYTSGSVQSNGFGHDAGGISGTASHNSIQNCSSFASVDAANFGNAGGIAGMAEKCLIENCYASNAVINQTDSYFAKGNLSPDTCLLLKFEKNAGYITGKSKNTIVVDCYHRDGIKSNKILFPKNSCKIKSSEINETFRPKC